MSVETLHALEPTVKRWVRYAGELALDILTDDHGSHPLDRFVVQVTLRDREEIVLEHHFGHDVDGAQRDAAYIRDKLDSLTADEFESEFGIRSDA